MTVFKTFFKVLNKNKGFVIMYTAILLVFAISNSQFGETNINYTDSKPDMVVINHDKGGLISSDFVKYVDDNAKLNDISDEDGINDALFYRQVDYVVYIPSNFSNDFMSGKEPVLDVKSTGSYEATLADRLVSNYFKVLKMYSKFGYSETELLDQVKEKLIVDVDSEVVSSLDVDALSRMAFYFNFESYSIIACLVYIISLILSIFNSDKIRKRTIISSIDYKKNNRILFLSNCIYSFLVWIFYTLIALILFKGSMFTYAGLIFSLNSLLFTMCITALAFMIGNLVHNKDALNGITNVLAIGSSFLCGAFVPVEYLPDGVLSFAHVLPTYYYINTNELLINIEKYNFDSLLPIIWNSIFILAFMFIFIIMSNFISRCRRKFG